LNSLDEIVDNALGIADAILDVVENIILSNSSDEAFKEVEDVSLVTKGQMWSSEAVVISESA